uniref:AsIV-cont00087-ORF2 n=1 Tax=Apophua simplicipes ichnovirus TaxID=1329648 RepID=S5DMM3_9VIRU|nr:AsIV-cont00087-ORF2 [Apophua simplicipes ichnovirus]
MITVFDRPNDLELLIMVRLMFMIESCTVHLRKYKHRDQLSAAVRTQLVQIQLRKAKMVAQLKSMLYQRTYAPPITLKIYY